MNLPPTWFYYKVDSVNAAYSKSGYLTLGENVAVYLSNGSTTNFYFYPFGTPFDLQFSGGASLTGNFLDVQYFPEGSVFYYTLEYGSNWINTHIVFNDDPFSTSVYVDSSGKVVAQYDNDVGVSTYTYSEWITKVFSNTIRQVGGSKGFAFGHRPFSVTFDVAGASDVSFNFKVTSVQLILSIPSLYRMREQSEVTNGLLKQILDALDASSGGASGAFNDSVNGVTGELGSLGDQLSGVDRPDPGDINTDISDYVNPGINASVYSLLSKIWASPLLLNMLFITLTLVTCSYVLFGKK